MKAEPSGLVQTRKQLERNTEQPGILNGGRQMAAPGGGEDEKAGEQELEEQEIHLSGG